MARPRKDGTAPKTTKTTKAAKAKAADVEKSVETVETPTVVDAVVETPVVVPEVLAESEAESTDKSTEEETATEDAPAVVDALAEEPQTGDAPTEEPVAETEKKDDAPKKTKKVAINGIVSLSGPTAIYRGPGVYPFAKINGVVKPLGDADETGYTKVQCVISGTGVCEGYIKL